MVDNKSTQTESPDPKTVEDVKPEPVESEDSPSSTDRKTVSEMAHEVIDKKWGSGESARSKLARAGYNPTAVLTEVDRIQGNSKLKSNEQIAKEVKSGKWGSGLARHNDLVAAGYSPQMIQVELDRLKK